MNNSMQEHDKPDSLFSAAKDVFEEHPELPTDLNALDLDELDAFARDEDEDKDLLAIGDDSAHDDTQNTAFDEVFDAFGVLDSEDDLRLETIDTDTSINPDTPELKEEEDLPQFEGDAIDAPLLEENMLAEQGSPGDHAAQSSTQIAPEDHTSMSSLLGFAVPKDEFEQPESQPEPDLQTHHAPDSSHVDTTATPADEYSLNPAGKQPTAHFTAAEDNEDGAVLLNTETSQWDHSDTADALVLDPSLRSAAPLTSVDESVLDFGAYSGGSTSFENTTEHNTRLNKEDMPSSSSAEQLNYAVLEKLPHEASVVLGRTQLSGKEVVELGYGSVIPLNKTIHDTVDLNIGGKAIAQCELVEIDGQQLGIRVVKFIL